MRSFRPGLALLAAGAAVAVFLYNAWLYCCGRCTIRHFFTLGPPGIFLLVLIAAAAFLWLSLLRRRRQSVSLRRCGCGENLTAGWQYCPACGTSVHP